MSWLGGGMELVKWRSKEYGSQVHRKVLMSEIPEVYFRGTCMGPNSL